MKLIIDISEEDFEIMKRNIAVDNPLCPINQKDMVIKIANGIPLSKEYGWILTSEKLPEKGQWVLVTKEERQKPIEIMCYQGIRIGQHDVGNGWEEYEYPSWTSGHGDIQGHHPKAWMPLPL